MSLFPTTTNGRGVVTLQPTYFTSSLFVDPLRQDILTLIRLYQEAYARACVGAGLNSNSDSTQPSTSTSTSNDPLFLPEEEEPQSQDKGKGKEKEATKIEPFKLFKEVWLGLGWNWFHFKVFDKRSREMFLSVVGRLFVEQLVGTQAPITRVVALFGLYTFFYTQPTNTAPELHSINRVPIPIDVYLSVLKLPTTLYTPILTPLLPHTSYILSHLLSPASANKFHFEILPHSRLNPHNPAVLPREIFVDDDIPAATITHGAQEGKKRGRPSKRDRMQKAKNATAGLERWLDTKIVEIPSMSAEEGQTSSQPQPQPRASKVKAGSVVSDPASSSGRIAKHTLLTHPPRPSLITYQSHKSTLLTLLHSFAPSPNSTHPALVRANELILKRMKKIDEMAAERGLEVGGEGGERTGLGRVERAVGELGGGNPRKVRRGGLLGLLEGAGLGDGEEEGEEMSLDKTGSGEGDVEMSLDRT